MSPFRSMRSQNLVTSRPTSGSCHLSIPRWIATRSSARVEIHGFCDASEKAYGACVYMRTTEPSGDTKVRLLCSKSYKLTQA